MSRVGATARSAVAALAVALAVATAVLVPVLVDGGGGGRGDRDRLGHSVPAAPGQEAGAGARGGSGSGAGEQEADDDCQKEESLRPAGPKAPDGPAVQRIKKRGKLVAGVDQNSYRWAYRDTDNLPPPGGELGLKGFDIDLVRAIAKDILGSPDAVIYRTIPTERRMPALQDRDVDVVVRTMTITCDRIKQVAFSTTYFKAGQQVLAPKGSKVTGFDDSLRGRKVCTAKSSTGKDELDKNRHGVREVVTAASQLDCLVKLQLGEVDAVITDSALAAGQAAQDPTVHLVGGTFTREPYGVAMNLADTDLVRRVNKVLEDYRKGGWQLSYRKWLADYLPADNPRPPPAMYKKE
ncbi:glutamate ABC transporter substrate-binding protein [Streptomyces sp. B1866]|uniref:glutamate ABC transporter substrate-binding protein n=1 Tax=Streptomyces sp. B1866 TaxID=3075431 RepID=UPI00288EA3EC|nr:glutamate ABC transporter substrate-binding protein [Streptomyces sp. B1866]MDT3397929.1 glutamate ABC transporter substrate-binding protein [Streptomyces sp. B1866]